MKNLKSVVLLLSIGLQFNGAIAQTSVINVKAPGFVRPLVEKWVAEYTKNKTDATFNMVNGSLESDSDAIQFIVSDGQDNPDAVYVSRYAILPITSRSSEAERILANKKLDAKRIRELFFVGGLDEEKKRQAADKLHVYAGNGRFSVARAYARYFGKSITDFRGKKISGDDSFLNTAIDKDPFGVTFNALPLIYDLESRQLKPGVSLIPLDTDKAVEKSLASLDEVIAVLENQRVEEIPVAKVGMVYDKGNETAHRFINWVLSEGVTFVHQYGLLQLKASELRAEIMAQGRIGLAQR